MTVTSKSSGDEPNELQGTMGRGLGGSCSATPRSFPGFGRYPTMIVSSAISRGRPYALILAPMDYHLQLSLLRFAKFSAIMLYASGVGIALGNFSVPTRKRAVHLMTSPALLATWLAGYGLTLYVGVALTELWVVFGFAASFIAQFLLTHAARRTAVGVYDRVIVLALVSAALLFMVLRPTWWSLKG